MTTLNIAIKRFLAGFMTLVHEPRDHVHKVIFRQNEFARSYNGGEALPAKIHGHCGADGFFGVVNAENINGDDGFFREIGADFGRAVIEGVAIG